MHRGLQNAAFSADRALRHPPPRLGAVGRRARAGRRLGVRAGPLPRRQGHRRRVGLRPARAALPPARPDARPRRARRRRAALGVAAPAARRPSAGFGGAQSAVHAAGLGRDHEWSSPILVGGDLARRAATVDSGAPMPASTLGWRAVALRGRDRRASSKVGRRSPSGRLAGGGRLTEPGLRRVPTALRPGWREALAVGAPAGLASPAQPRGVGPVVTPTPEASASGQVGKGLVASSRDRPHGVGPRRAGTRPPRRATTRGRRCIRRSSAASTRRTTGLSSTQVAEARCRRRAGPGPGAATQAGA